MSQNAADSLVSISFFMFCLVFQLFSILNWLKISVLKVLLTSMCEFLLPQLFLYYYLFFIILFSGFVHFILLFSIEIYFKSH